MIFLNRTLSGGFSFYPNMENLVKTLEQNGEYRVLRRFSKINQYHDGGSEIKLQGLFIDTETTGLDHQQDKIIEIVLVPFEFSKDGRIYKVDDGYNALQDPGILIDEKITLLTGITNEMVKGQVIDRNLIEEMVMSASIVIAHNAGFDRKFVEKQFPIFAEKAWGCSYAQVPWSKENIASSKLEYLAYIFGFFYEAHRANMDCLVGIHLLSQTLPSCGELVLKRLLANARSVTYQIWAEGARFDAKDLLKARGYRWNDGSNNKPRSWCIEVEEEQREAELVFLRKEVYLNKPDMNRIIINEINPFNRFSAR